MMNLTNVVIAPFGCDEEKKKQADFVCTGKNDEKIIQQAIEKCAKEEKTCIF